MVKNTNKKPKLLDPFTSNSSSSSLEPKISAMSSPTADL